VVVTPYNVTYDANPHTATYTVTGVGSDTAAVGSSINVAATTHTAAGTYNGDAWSFTGGANYNDQNGTIDDSIGKRPLTASIIGDPTKPYDANTNATLTSANYSIATLVAGQSITVNKTTGTYNSKDVAAAITVSATLAATDFAAGPGTNLNNYNLPAIASGAGHITPKALTIKADDKGMIFGGTTPAFTATDTGYAAGEGRSNLSGTLIFTVKTLPLTPGSTVTVNATTPVGPYAIIPSGVTSANYAITFTNGTLNITYLSTGSCMGDLGHSILQPINVDGSSVFKQKSTVPAKFRVCDATGHSIGTPSVVSSFVLYQVISGTVTTSANEAVDSTTPDPNFRWSATDQQWIFNIDTKTLQTNKTYVFLITLNDGSTIPFRFGLK
jgi:hypothetical protein